MAGSVGDISDPVPVVVKHINRVTAYLAARQRASAIIEALDRSINGGNEHAMDLC